MWIRRLRYWLSASQRQAALRAEMELHIEERTAELRQRGKSEADARAEARRSFGNLAAVEEQSREVWIARQWSDFAQDVRYGARNLRRNPGLATVAIISAALGIGACSTVFSIVNFAVFRPLPVDAPDRLMAINALKNGVPGGSMSYPEVRDLGEGMRSWDGVAAFAPFLPAGIRAEGAARRHWGFLVTANYFDIVKPRFAAGRGFMRGEDDIPGAPAKIVLTHALWVSRFGGDPAIVGRTIRVNQRAMTVSGITGPGFRGTEVGIAAEFFLPFSQYSEMDAFGKHADRLTSYNAQWLTALARLQPGTDVRRARAELETASTAMRRRIPELSRDRSFYAERAGQLLPFLRNIALPAFLLLLTVTFLVLLTACANVANLMLARASAREREIATRLAIGAGRGRLIRQLLTESLLLALAGGLVGIVLAEWAGRHIGGFRLPLPLPLDLAIPTDYRVLLFSAALSVITGLAFGLVPAFRATRPDLASSIRSNSGRVRRWGLRNALVVAQVAISAVLVICSGLFLRSLNVSQGIDSGMKPANLTLVRFDPALSRYDEQRTKRLLLDVLRDANSLPGVHSASVTNLLPLSIGGNFTRAGALGTRRDSETVRCAVMAVGPRYFETMGIPLRSGEDFRPAASTEPVAIVNEELARRLYPDQNVIGRFVTEFGGRARIIAVAGNSKYRMVQESEVTPILYRPILHTLNAEGAFGGITLIVRAAHDPVPLGEMLRNLLRQRDPELVVNLAGTMEAHVRESMFLSSLAASLFAICGMVGLLIASVGVYGVISFTVASRAREIGIRMALGARISQVVATVLWHGVALAMLGIATGIAGGAALTLMARSLIYGVSPTDPVTFFTVPVILMTVALLAAAIPARRAAMVDPTRTLRAE